MLTREQGADFISKEETESLALLGLQAPVIDVLRSRELAALVHSGYTEAQLAGLSADELRTLSDLKLSPRQTGTGLEVLGGKLRS